MSLPIIGADERLAQRKGIKGVIFGRSGIGKTSLLWTLNASTTLFLDLEAGDLAVEGQAGLRRRISMPCGAPCSKALSPIPKPSGSTSGSGTSSRH